MMTMFCKVVSTVLSVGSVYWLLFGWTVELSLVLPILMLGGCIALRGPSEPAGTFRTIAVKER